MFADPGFMEAEPVEPLHQLQSALDARRRVFVHRIGMAAGTRRDAAECGMRPWVVFLQRGRFMWAAYGTAYADDVIRVHGIADPPRADPTGDHEPIV